MAAFSNYSHIESTVEAVQLSADSQYEVVAALAKEAEAGLLSTLNIEYDSTSKCYQFVFRYKTDTVESTLVVGDYLVRLNEGNYIRCDEATFEERYLPTFQDADAMPAHPQSPKGALVAFIKAFYPDAGINSEADLTADKLQTIVDGLKAWYNEETDTFDLKFCDCSITDPSGLADLLAAFPKASFIKDTTVFTLNFNNGAWHEGDPNTEPNCFNYAGLQSLIGELKQVDPDYAKRLVGITFLSVGHNAPSAVAASVTDAQWDDFVTNAMAITGVKARADIKR